MLRTKSRLCFGRPPKKSSRLPCISGRRRRNPRHESDSRQNSLQRAYGFQGCNPPARADGARTRHWCGGQGVSGARGKCLQVGLLWSLVAPCVAPHVPARLVSPARCQWDRVPGGGSERRCLAGSCGGSPVCKGHEWYDTPPPGRVTAKIPKVSAEQPGQLAGLSEVVRPLPHRKASNGFCSFTGRKN